MKIVNETKEVDYATGEIKKKSLTTSFKSEEPNFIKIYLEDISYLYAIPKSAGSMVYELFSYMVYNQNRIILNSSIKKEISKKLNITLQSVQNNLYKLTKKGILKKEADGIYILNPFLFGKGDWKSIKELRNQNIEMKIIYNKETNKREIYTELEKNPSLPFENFENQEDKEKVS